MGIIGQIEAAYKASELFAKIIGWLRKSWKNYVYISLGITVVCILTNIPIVYEFCKKQFPDINGLIDITHKHSNIIISIILFTYICGYIYKIWRLSKESTKYAGKQQTTFDELHIKFIHDIRDNIRELDDIRSGYEETLKRMEQDLTNNCQVYVDYLAEYIGQYRNCNVTVTIKTRLPEDQDLVKTLVRSSNTKNERNKDNEIAHISLNSDFKELSVGRNFFYAQADMKTACENGEYENEEDISVWGKKYNSTLVTPIRYYSKKSRHNNIDLKFEVLGFLCIDCKEIQREWENVNSLELSLLAIFSDGLYLYFNKYKQIKESIERRMSRGMANGT